MQKGDIAIVEFPFSDLTNTKRRPCLIIAKVSDDYLILQMTQQEHNIGYNVQITNNDLIYNNLNINSDCYVRCHKAHFLNSSLVIKKVDTIKKDKLEEITDNLKKIIDDGTCS